MVRIDRDTGHVEVERYLVAYDIGRAVNPMLVEGQIAGGFAQGIGGSLFEEFTYDERGEPLNVTFADYLMPTAREVPELDVLICEDAPSPLNPLGLKGAGEGGTNAVGAAMASAIDDALQHAGRGDAASGHAAAAEGDHGSRGAVTFRSAQMSSCACVPREIGDLEQALMPVLSREWTKSSPDMTENLRHLLQQPHDRALLFGGQRRQRLSR